MVKRDLLGLVELCYASVASEAEWATFTAAASAAFDAPVAAVCTITRNPDGFDWAMAHGFDEAAFAEAVERATDDPRAALYELLQPGQGYIYDDVHGHDIAGIKRTAYYEHVLTRLDVLWCLTARIDEARDLEGFIALHRSERADRFTSTDLREAEVLARHVGRARRLQLDLELAEARVALQADLLDRLPVGLVLLKGGLRVLQMNAAARRIVEARDGFAYGLGRISVADGDTARRLEQLVGAAERGRLDGVGGVLPVPRHAGRPAYAVSVVRCVSGLARAVGTGATVLLAISDPLRAAGVDARTLRALWPLTAAEAQLALALAAGQELDEIARRQGIALSTARAHLRHLLAKTGTRRQADLVRLILAGPGALPGTPEA
ncbi:MAG: helix-turn-helix transcriptional regulator [Geminicoccaceae bacterium]